MILMPFMQKILRLKPLKALIHAPSAAERGILYHAILATFCRQVKTQMLQMHSIYSST